MARIEVHHPGEDQAATLERFEITLMNARADVESIRGRLLRLAFNPRDPAIQWCEEIASAIDQTLGPPPARVDPLL